MDLCEFKASLVYRASSKSARDTQRNPVSKKTKKKKTKKKVCLPLLLFEIHWRIKNC